MSGNAFSDFPDREIDASMNFCCWLVLCPCTFGVIPFRTTLLLEKEEVTRTDADLCGTQVSKRPYGELGSVDRSTCLCCISAQSAFGPLSPGCGCEKERVDEIVTELKQRMRGRGDTAQIQRAEETLERLDEVDAKLDAIIKHLNIPMPKKMVDRGEADANAA